MKNITFDCFGLTAEAAAALRAVLKRKLELRNIALTPSGGYRLYAAVTSIPGKERFVICYGDGWASVAAADGLSLFAAVGRFLLDTAFDGRGDFVPRAAGTVTDFTPAKPLRGMYFATHFYNFYHSAPLKEVFEVIDDLALHGCNSLLVWFDMHHFTSMQDPAAKELTGRLHAIIRYANSIGMGGSLLILSNEGFQSSPEELRAEWHVQGKYKLLPRGHYHRELCPSKPGGIEEILRERREVLAEFTDLKMDYIVYWPYDQGGCTCMQCQPWGSNGFVRLFPHVRDLAAEMIPGAKIIVSTWHFDKFVDGEWEEFYPQMGKGEFSDVAYYMSFFFNGNRPACIEKNGVPEGVHFIDFPEISMYSCNPWGGFGASVLTRFLGRTNDVCAPMYQGGFPYSEGIFEEANKFIQMASYTGLYPDAHDALRAWVKSEFCCADEELYEAVEKTETALARVAVPGGEYATHIRNTTDTKFVYDTFEKYNALLPEKITSSRNFRLFYLRAVIDRELALNDGCPTRSARCVEAMQEVDKIYHVTPDTVNALRTPLTKMRQTYDY